MSTEKTKLKAELVGPQEMACRCGTLLLVWTTAAAIPVVVEDRHGHPHLCPTTQPLYAQPAPTNPREEEE